MKAATIILAVFVLISFLFLVVCLTVDWIKDYKYRHPVTKIKLSHYTPEELINEINEDYNNPFIAWI